MAYQTYTTDAIVVGSSEGVNADRTITLFAREAGLLFARAVSVRKEDSKLRYGLQDFSLSRVSLVRGKSGWRVTGAESALNFYFSTDDRARRAALFRTIKLLRRLVRGEEAHPALFDILKEGLETLCVCEEDTLVWTEHVLALRMLALLGYVPSHHTHDDLIAAPSLSAFSAPHHNDMLVRIKESITRALEASHL